MDPTGIQVAHVRSFSGDIHDLAAQQKSRLEMLARDDVTGGENGSAHYFDRLGDIEVIEITSRHQKTELNDPPHSRRLVSPRDFYAASGIDKSDKRRILSGSAIPGKYVQKQIAAINRKKDDLIIAAYFGNATSIDEDLGETLIAFDANNVVVNGGTGLTKAKILTVLEGLRTADVGEDTGEDVQLHAVVSPRAMTNLMNDSEVTSSDNNTIKALMHGEIDEWLDFKWHRSNRLPKTGDIRSAMFFAEGAFGLKKPQDIMTDITVRPDLLNMWQSLSDFSMNAVRIEEALAWQIDYDETA